MVGFEERLTPEIESVLYRLSQEALTNTLKHADAGRFKLSIIKGYPHIIFLAEDDGNGFDTDARGGNNEALGLLSMRERAAMLGGSFTLRSAPGGGTRIRIEIPVQEAKNE
jgi:signal transduction histidine kinase